MQLRRPVMKIPDNIRDKILKGFNDSVDIMLDCLTDETVKFGERVSAAKVIIDLATNPNINVFDDKDESDQSIKLVVEYV